MTPRPHSALATDPHDRKERLVYIVDDDESIRLSLESLLRSSGLRVQTFESAQDFLAFPKVGGPSCLVLDVRLRGESGLAFQEQIAKSGVDRKSTRLNSSHYCATRM